MRQRILIGAWILAALLMAPLPTLAQLPGGVQVPGSGSLPSAPAVPSLPALPTKDALLQQAKGMVSDLTAMKSSGKLATAQVQQVDGLLRKATALTSDLQKPQIPTSRLASLQAARKGMTRFMHLTKTTLLGVVLHRLTPGHAAGRPPTPLFVCSYPADPGAVDPLATSQLFLAAPASPPLKLLTAPLGDAWPAWSPDRLSIAFSSLRSGSREIWTMDANGGNLRQLTFLGAVSYFPAWSPDGRLIAFMSDAVSHNEVWIVRADGTEAAWQLTFTEFGAGEPSFSPDGTKLIFTFDDGTYLSLWTFSTDGWRQLTFPHGLASEANAAGWSPDGALIAFYGGVRDQLGQIHVMNADGSGQHPITDCAQPCTFDNPSWSPDGQWIFAGHVDSAGHAWTWIIARDGSYRQPVLDYNCSDGRQPWGF